MKDISTPTYKSENYNGKDIYYMKSTHDDKYLVQTKDVSNIKGLSLAPSNSCHFGFSLQCFECLAFQAFRVCTTHKILVINRHIWWMHKKH